MIVGILQHAFAMLIALAVVFGLRVQDINLQPLLGEFDETSFVTYTPYFPGLDALQTHEIFAPENRHKKKIVLLGASAAESIGCDYTWSDDAQGRNAHYDCSITAKLNSLLKDANLGDWRAFNLARGGSKLTAALYIYARILSLQPETVIYGDSFNYYMWENADASAISPERYAFMDEVFNRYPETAALWGTYKANLQRHGWTPASAKPEPVVGLGPQPRASTSLNDLIVQGLVVLRSRLPVSGPLRPSALNPSFRAWTKPPYEAHAFKNPDPDFGYFQGFKLIGEMQKRQGKRFSFFFCPQWERDSDLDYQNGLTSIFGAYLEKDGIPFASYVPMKMTPVYETWDGSHHLPQGNLKIARAIFAGLQQNGSLP
ncbi:MAG: hypothetical protein QOD09_957 [Bradyrhizobium sp.]|jgi:hypothetical protein|nr:hypothetical protein [Bradyrhizobium sp.]